METTAVLSNNKLDTNSNNKSVTKTSVDILNL